MAVSSIRAGQAYIELTTKDSKLVKGLMNAQVRLKAFGQSVTGLGTKFVGVAAAMAVAMGFTVRKFADFDDQMRLVQGVTGATDTELSTLTETAKKLGRETSYTAAQVAQGMVALARMGFTVDEINKSMRHFMNLDRATGMNDLGMSAEIASAAMRSFGLAAQDSERIADVLTATANGSAQTLVDLGEALKMAAPNAHMANATLEDTCAMLGVLANMGIKGSMAGSALAKTFQRLASGKGVDILEGKGIKTTDANGNLRSMRDILTDIAKVTQKMGSAEKIDFLTKVFDVRGAKGGGVISANLKDLDAMIQKIVNSEGVAEATAKKMDSGIGGAFRKLSGAIDGVGIEIGNIIGEYLQPYVQALSNILAKVAEWVKAHKDLVTGVVKFVGVIAGVGATLLALGAAVKLVGLTCGIMAVGIRALILPIVLVQKALVLLKATLLVLKAVAVATWAVVSSPMFMFIGAALAVVTVLWSITGALDMLMNAMRGLGAGFSAAFATIGQVAKESYAVIKTALAAGDLAGAARVGLAALKVVWLAGIQPLKQAWYDLKYFFADSWSMMSYGILKVANDLWYGLLIGLKTIANGIATAWGELWDGIIDAFMVTLAIIKRNWLRFKGFFKSDAEIDAEIAKVDRELDEGIANRASDRERGRVRREGEKRQLENEHKERNEMIDKLGDDQMRQNRTDYDKAMRDAAKGVSDARAEWQKAVDDLKRKNSENKGERQRKIEEKTTDIAKKQTELQAKSQSTVGDFSARAAMMNLGFGPQERIAKASEATAKNTGELTELFQQNFTIG